MTLDLGPAIATRKFPVGQRVGLLHSDSTGVVRGYDDWLVVVEMDGRNGRRPRFKPSELSPCRGAYTD